MTCANQRLHGETMDNVLVGSVIIIINLVHLVKSSNTQLCEVPVCIHLYTKCIQFAYNVHTFIPSAFKMFTIKLTKLAFKL